ncbi:hypothetical protein PLICRDRAFT_181020 [Plicaturopsis crispa FD-325 SS-3]|uniref:Uncharacterized protein n=1 Tax=Plicaturopsis crispa FD-325 SS-3 TaxID=944288 RepID=A0A0C9T3Z6_PLICR|nr:hypothetical protein PLICRDRAFT_181020 [Plicaturopsis crispa FD-325 SS-3]
MVAASIVEEQPTPHYSTGQHLSQSAPEGASVGSAMPQPAHAIPRDQSTHREDVRPVSNHSNGSSHDISKTAILL